MRARPYFNAVSAHCTRFIPLLNDINFVRNNFKNFIIELICTTHFGGEGGCWLKKWKYCHVGIFFVVLSIWSERFLQQYRIIVSVSCSSFYGASFCALILHLNRSNCFVMYYLFVRRSSPAGRITAKAMS